MSGQRRRAERDVPDERSRHGAGSTISRSAEPPLVVANPPVRSTMPSRGSHVITNSRTASAMRASPAVNPGHATFSSISIFSIAGGLASNRCTRSGRPANNALFAPVMARIYKHAADATTGWTARIFATRPAIASTAVSGPRQGVSTVRLAGAVKLPAIATHYRRRPHAAMKAAAVAGRRVESPGEEPQR